MKTLKTFLKLFPETNLEVEEEVFDSYQHFLNLIQRACIELILSKGDISSVLLRGVHVNEKCISLEIFGKFNLPSFILNVYLFQFVSCPNNKAVDLFEISIGKYEENEQVISLIKDAILFKTSSLRTGLYSEKLISDVLIKMKSEGNIISFRKSSMLDDIAGIDYYFSIRGYMKILEEIPLQIKSSSSAQKHHEKKFPKIPSLVVSVKTTPEELMEKIIKIGMAYTACLKKVLHL